MILYNITLAVDESVHREWVEWMKSEHIPAVLATGLFLDHRFWRMLSDHGQTGVTYCVQYHLQSMADFEDYEKHYADQIRQQTQARFGERTVAFRTLLEAV